MANARQVTTPGIHPVSRAQAKANSRVDFDGEDDWWDNAIAHAVSYVEGELLRPLVARRYEMRLDGFADIDAVTCGDIRLRYPPLINVTGITYLDQNGTETTLAADQYRVEKYANPARISESYQSTWPITRGVMGDVTISYNAGYVVPFTVNASTDTLTVTGISLADDLEFELSNNDGSLPGGLAAATRYYTVSASGSTAKLSATSGGSAIDITSAGTGTHFLGVMPSRIRQAILLLCSHWYENREAVAVGTITKEIEFGVQALLSRDMRLVYA